MRKACVHFYQALVTQVPSVGLLAPFLDTLMLFTHTAATHLREDIRYAAIDFIELWLKSIPNLLLKAKDEKLMQSIFLLLGGPHLTFKPAEGAEKKPKTSLSQVQIVTNQNSIFSSVKVKDRLFQCLLSLLRIGLESRAERKTEGPTPTLDIGADYIVHRVRMCPLSKSLKELIDTPSYATRRATTCA